jgi:hypothetical protein
MVHGKLGNVQLRERGKKRPAEVFSSLNQLYVGSKAVK